MLDIKRIINEKDKVYQALLKRGVDINYDEVIELYNERNKILIEVENLKKEKIN